MTPLQKKLLEMLAWLDNFIRNSNLTYYVVEGTLIGAARHQGFIPWDDDIDIAMPRPDYNIICKLLKNPVDHYVIETINGSAKDFIYTSAKFYDINTSMTELSRKNIKRGVSIDIFPLDGIGNDYEEALRNYKAIDRKNMFLMTRVCAYRKERKWYKNAAIFLSRMIPDFIINDKEYARKIDRLNQKYDYLESKYITLAMSTYRKKDIHKKSLLGKPVELPFENIRVLAPQHYDEFLSDTYGDWRQLPPENKRQSAHDYTEIDLCKSYLDTDI